MLSYKEFYIWLEGYLYGKLENKHIDIAPIVEKMSQVKEDDNSSTTPRTLVPPQPINPFPKRDDPYKPPYEIYCGTKKE